MLIRTHTARTRTYTCEKSFSEHHGAAHTVPARARRNKIDKVYATHFRDGHAPTPNYINDHTPHLEGLPRGAVFF